MCNGTPGIVYMGGGNVKLMLEAKYRMKLKKKIGNVMTNK